MWIHPIPSGCISEFFGVDHGTAWYTSVYSCTSHTVVLSTPICKLHVTFHVPLMHLRNIFSSFAISAFGPMSSSRTSYHPCMHCILPVAHDRCSHPERHHHRHHHQAQGSGLRSTLPPARVCHGIPWVMLAYESSATPGCAVVHTSDVPARPGKHHVFRKTNTPKGFASHRGTGQGCMALPFTGSLHPTRPRVKVRPYRLVRSS